MHNTTTKAYFAPISGIVRFSINIFDLPVIVMGYMCIPLAYRLLYRLCRQNWMFLQIAYLHRWQLVLDSAPIRPLVRHWKLIAAVSLFAGCAAPAVMILYSSTILFRSYWSSSPYKSQAAIVQHLALFLVTCAPITAVCSAAATGVYFIWKQRKYGTFQANMRKQGKRGYWADPWDLEERRTWENRKEARDGVMELGGSGESSRGDTEEKGWTGMYGIETQRHR